MIPALLLAAGSILEPTAPCGHSLIAWDSVGEVAPGREWTFRILAAPEDVAEFRELTIRFGKSWLSPDESRWFDEPAALRPQSFVVSVTHCEGDCWESICRDLRPSLSIVGAEVGVECSRNEQGETVREVRSTSARRDGSGFVLQPAPARARDCVKEIGLGPEKIQVERQSEERAEVEPTAERRSFGVLAELRTTMGRLSERRAPPLDGVAALTAARVSLLSAPGLLEGGLPARLPSMATLAVLVLRAHESVPYLLEHVGIMEEEDDRTLFESVLASLGEVAARGHEASLVHVIRSAVRERDARTTGLALRALLRADRDLARAAAFEMFGDDDVRWPALGVFALTEPELAKRLEETTKHDPASIEAAVAAVRDHLCAAGAKEPLSARACPESE